MTYEQWITTHGVKFSAHEVTTRPDGLMGDSAFHFKCRVMSGRRGFTLYFSKGSGLGPAIPTLTEVLDCIASDASGYENASSFEDWASEYGYEADSRSAEKIYRTVKRQAEQLKRILTRGAYSDLLWNTERL